VVAELHELFNRLVAVLKLRGKARRFRKEQGFELVELEIRNELLAFEFGRKGLFAFPDLVERVRLGAGGLNAREVAS